MEKFILLSSFIVVTFCSTDSQTYCHGLECPKYEVTAVYPNKDEERMYPNTSWITTEISTTQQQDALAAYSRLKEYCDSHGEAGKRIKKTWPALITQREDEHFLSWFVPDDVSAQDDPVGSVTVTTIPAGKFCVRSFGGIPSLTEGEKNMKILQQICGHGEDEQTYIGAVYDAILSFTHHNEVWIKAD